MYRPLLGWVTDVGAVNDERHRLRLVNPTTIIINVRYSLYARRSPCREVARTVGANRQQYKEIQHPPKRTTPEWSHTAVVCMADGQPSALRTGRHPGSETSVGLPGEQKLHVRRSHMRPEPYHDELHTFRSETECRRHCGNEG